jgi:Na+/proline symporter
MDTLGISVILYLIATVGIGLYSTKYVNSSKDFLSSGRRLGFLLSSADLFALWFGSETLLGATSEFQERGWRGLLEEPIGAFLCLMLYGLFFAKRLYQLNLISIVDLFRIKIGRKTEVYISWIMILTFLGYIAAQFIALSVLFQLIFHISFEIALVIVCVMVTSYSILGGMWSISLTDFVESILILGGLLYVFFYFFYDTDAWALTSSEIRNRVLEEPIIWNMKEITNVIGGLITLGLGGIISQDIFQRTNASKSALIAKRSSLTGGILYIIISLLPILITVYAGKMNYLEELEDTQTILPTMIIHHTPILVQILFMGALVSAILSTCSGAILAPATVVSENLIRKVFEKKFKTDIYKDKYHLIVIRLSMLSMSFLAFLIANNNKSIFELASASSAIGLVGLFVPFVYILNSDKPSAFLSNISAFLGCVVWGWMTFVDDFGYSPAFFGFCMSLITLVIGLVWIHLVRSRVY